MYIYTQYMHIYIYTHCNNIYIYYIHTFIDIWALPHIFHFWIETLVIIGNAG